MDAEVKCRMYGAGTFAARPPPGKGGKGLIKNGKLGGTQREDLGRR